MNNGLHVKYSLFFPDFNELNLTDFLKNSDIKLHENPSDGSQVIPCG